MTGDAKNRPAISATFIWTQKASVTARKTSGFPVAWMGWARWSTILWLNGNAIARPIRTPMSAREMRIRSSPRCSMNDILSFTARAIVLPALHEVPEHAHAAARLERLADGVTEGEAPGEVGGDGRGERAPGAVRARRLQARCREARDLAPVPQDV